MSSSEIDPALELVSDAEGMEILDSAARLHLNISAADFLERWDAQDVDGFEHVALMKVATLIPLAR